jgi:hypothetical protein
MKRELTDADEFSIAMGGAIVVALVLTFVIGGLVTHWEKKEASANLKGDPSRVSAVIESARVSYWSKDMLDGLKVQFGDEVYTPKITPVARNYSVVHRGHGNSGAGVYRKSDGKLGVGFVSGTGYGWYIGSGGKIGTGWVLSGSNTPTTSESVTSTRYLYSFNVPASVYANDGGSLVNPDCGAECSVILPSGAVERLLFSAKYDLVNRSYSLLSVSKTGRGSYYDIECGVSRVNVRLKNLTVGKTYVLGGYRFTADSKEHECVVEIPNYGVYYRELGDQEVYRVDLSSIDEQGNAVFELRFNVYCGRVDV